MGKTNKCNLEEDEALSNEVQKHPCLFNKACKGYKEKDRKANAWSVVEASLGYEDGTASKKFDALKKRYSKKRNKLKSKQSSGAGLKDVTNAKKQFNEYSFMGWLDSYIQPRTTFSNCLDDENEENENQADGEIDDEEEESDVDDNILLHDAMNGESVEKRPESVRQSRPRPPSTTLGKNDAARTDAKTEKRQRDTLKNRELKLMEGMESIVERRIASEAGDKDDTDTNFGKLVGSELKYFNDDEKSDLKHEIYDLIYKHKKMKRQRLNPLFVRSHEDMHSSFRSPPFAQAMPQRYQGNVHEDMHSSFRSPPLSQALPQRNQGNVHEDMNSSLRSPPLSQALPQRNQGNVSLLQQIEQEFPSTVHSTQINNANQDFSFVSN